MLEDETWRHYRIVRTIFSPSEDAKRVGHPADGVRTTFRQNVSIGRLRYETRASKSKLRSGNGRIEEHRYYNKLVLRRSLSAIGID